MGLAAVRQGNVSDLQGAFVELAGCFSAWRDGDHAGFGNLGRTPDVRPCVVRCALSFVPEWHVERTGMEIMHAVKAARLVVMRAEEPKLW